MRKTAAVLCAALLTLSACGNDDEATAKENIKKAVLENEDQALTAGVKPTEEQADCISDGMVDDVGVETLQEYDLLTEELEINESAEPQDMKEEDADALAGVFVDCIDVEKLFSEQMAGAGEQLTPDQTECISDALDDETLKGFLSAMFQGEEEGSAMSEMQDALMQCVLGDMGSGEGEMQLE